jgi:hypothetical protein
MKYVVEMGLVAVDMHTSFHKDWFGYSKVDGDGCRAYFNLKKKLK